MQTKHCLNFKSHFIVSLQISHSKKLKITLNFHEYSIIQLIEVNLLPNNNS
jgi:hypothetical protein